MKIRISYTQEDVQQALDNFQKGHYTHEDYLVIQQVLIEKLESLEKPVDDYNV